MRQPHRGAFAERKFKMRQWHRGSEAATSRRLWPCWGRHSKGAGAIDECRAAASIGRSAEATIGSVPGKGVFGTAKNLGRRVNQDLHGFAPAAGEYKQSALERFALEFLAAQSSQSVDAFAQIHRLHRQQDPLLRCDLDHAQPFKNAWINLRISAQPLWARRSLSLSPDRFSNSAAHAQDSIAPGTLNSRKVAALG